MIKGQIKSEVIQDVWVENIKKKEKSKKEK
jgi:hypothetical protein